MINSFYNVPVELLFKGNIMKGKTIKKDHPEFENTLNMLQEKFFHSGGDPCAEVVINWNKQQIKEEGTVSFFATNSAVASAIKRCRPGIVAVNYTKDGAELTFDSKFVRPMHTVLKVAN